MASVLRSAGLTLPNFADANVSGNTIAECLPFADGYTWGPLAKADVILAGLTAQSISVNVINDNSSYTSAPASCTALGTSLNAVSAFDANGVLGVGVFDQDCGVTCADCAAVGNCSQAGDIYYSCGGGSCQFTAVGLTDQVRNPVATLATDNNGVILQLPAISASGAVSATGSLTLGIGTRADNSLQNATVILANQRGDFTTVYNSQALNSSFIDSGSNGLYFADSGITTCSSDPTSAESRFYCPRATLSLSALNQGLDGTTSQISFQIANLKRISGRNYAINDVGGGIGGISGLSNFFDWGLPFFYGRSVYTAIEGRAVGTYSGPFYAY